MRPKAILHEIQQLYNVSDRLDSLAEQHSLVRSNSMRGIGVEALCLPLLTSPLNQ